MRGAALTNDSGVERRKASFRRLTKEDWDPFSGRSRAHTRARVACVCSGCKRERLTRLATAWNRVRRGCVGSGKAAEKSAKPQSVSKSNNLKVVAKRDKGLIGTHKKTYRLEGGGARRRLAA